MSEQIHLDSLEILGWYDGVTHGVATCDGAYFLVFLMACQIVTNTRIFAVLPIKKGFAEALIQFPRNVTAPENPLAFNELLNCGISAHEGKAFLTRDQIEEDRTITIYHEREFKSSDLIELDDDAPFDDLHFERWSARLDLLANAT